MRRLILGCVSYPQNKIDDDGEQQYDGQEGWAEAVVKAGLASDPNRLGAPVVCRQGVYHGHHGDAREEESRDEGGPVAKVEHADGEGAEDDGEVHPREEGALVGEKDLGLDAGGEGNSLAWQRWATTVSALWPAGGGTRPCKRRWGSLPGAVWRSGWLDMLKDS